MTTPSELVRRIVGTYIEEDKTPRPPLLEWLQAECRHGCLKTALEEAIKQQPEPLRLDLAIVEKADPDKVTVRVPCRVVDHESTSTFETDVTFEVNPLSMSVKRL